MNQLKYVLLEMMQDFRTIGLCVILNKTMNRYQLPGSSQSSQPQQSSPCISLPQHLSNYLLKKNKWCDDKEYRNVLVH